MWRISAATLVAALLAPDVASACGGFFCSTTRPVDQAAEEVVFAVDEDAGEVTMHVRITYTGEAEDFAWVVPVPGVPTLEIGTDALFPILSQLRAQFFLTRDFGGCGVPVAASASGDDDDDGGGGGGGVTVVSTGVVGPYETAVLQATDSAELLGWLLANGYDLPADLDPVLAPYVADGQSFVALKLAKDKDTGDLEPLVLTYPGLRPAIPIQLTSIAATEDMRLRVYVLGDHRAVPDSYLHLVINELAVDWWTGGANLEAVITRAADEAGGHGFFTDYAGPTTPIRGQLWRDGWSGADDEVRLAPDAAKVLSVLIAHELPFDDALLGVLSDHFGLADTALEDELDLLDVVDCLGVNAAYGYGWTVDPAYCYPEELGAIAFDPDALAADLEARVLEPRRRTEQLLGAHPKITRLTSDVSPIEMTVDPTFTFNPDLPDVALRRDAVETFLCDGDDADLFFDAERELALPDGRVVRLPSRNALSELGLTEIEWLELQGLTSPANARIEETGPAGEPVVLTDNTDLLWSQLDPGALGGAGRCGCGTATAAGVLPAAVALGLASRRRRRVSARP